MAPAHAKCRMLSSTMPKEVQIGHVWQLSAFPSDGGHSHLLKQEPFLASKRFLAGAVWLLRHVQLARKGIRSLNPLKQEEVRCLGHQSNIDASLQGESITKSRQSPSRSRGMSSNALKGLQNGQLESTATSRPMKKVASDPGLRRLGSKRLINGRRNASATRVARVAWVGCAWLLWIICMALSGYFLLSMLLDSRTSASLDSLSTDSGRHIPIQAPNATMGGFGIKAKVREILGGWTGFNGSKLSTESLEQHHQLPEWDASAGGVENLRKGGVNLGRKGRFIGGAGGLLRWGFEWLGLRMQHSPASPVLPDLPEALPELEEKASESGKEEKIKEEAKGTTFVMPRGLEHLGTGVSGLWQPPSAGAFWEAVAGKKLLLVTRDWPKGCFFGQTMLNVAGTALSSGAQVTVSILEHKTASELHERSSFFSEELRSLGVTNLQWASQGNAELAGANDVILVTSAYAGSWLEGLLASRPQVGGRIAWWIVEGKRAEFKSAREGLLRMLAAEENLRRTVMFVNEVQAQRWDAWLREAVAELEEAQRGVGQAGQTAGVNIEDEHLSKAVVDGDQNGIHTRPVRRDAVERRKLAGLTANNNRERLIGGRQQRRYLLQLDAQAAKLRGELQSEGAAVLSNGEARTEEKSAQLVEQQTEDEHSDNAPLIDLTKVSAALSPAMPWYRIVPMPLDRNVLLAAGLAEPGQINENSLATARQHRQLLRRYYRRDVLHVWDDEFLALVVGSLDEEEGHLFTLEAIKQLVSSLADGDEDDEIADPDREFNLFERDSLWGGIDELEGDSELTPREEEGVALREEEDTAHDKASNNQIVGRSFGMEVQDDRKRTQGGAARVDVQSTGRSRAEGAERGPDSKREAPAAKAQAEPRTELERAQGGETGRDTKGPFEDLTLAEQMDDKRRRRHLLSVTEDEVMYLRGTNSVSPVSGGGSVGPRSKITQRTLLQEETSSPEIALRLLFLITNPLPLNTRSRQCLVEIRSYLKKNPRLRSVVSIGHLSNFQASGVFASADTFIVNRQADGDAVHGRLLQAMAYGLPILSTPVLPAAGLLVDNKNAMLHDVSTSGAAKLVTDLQSVMEDPEGARQIGAQASQLIKARHMESVLFEGLGRALSQLQ